MSLKPSFYLHLEIDPLDIVKLACCNLPVKLFHYFSNNPKYSEFMNISNIHLSYQIILVYPSVSVGGKSMFILEINILFIFFINLISLYYLLLLDVFFLVVLQRAPVRGGVKM